jgi:hypothetical protein
MKCPYRKIIDKSGNITTENFAECYGNDCPFFGVKEMAKRYEGGYYERINPICRRTVEKEER